MAFTVTLTEEGMTLLSFLRRHCPEAPSVKAIKRAIEGKCCSVNGCIEIFSSHPLQKGDRICLNPSSFSLPDRKSKQSAKILFEDDFLLVCNKPAGVACENRNIPFLFPEHSSPLFLVHRLDRETSGALILAKDLAVQEKMITLFKEHRVRKLYLALVDGTVSQEKGKIENYLGKKGGYQGQTLYGNVGAKKGQHAVTLWRCLHKTQTASLLLAQPVTGRTHQLRVHFSAMGHPLLGDAQYGKRFKCALHPPCHLLHAYSLCFPHPTRNEEIEVLAPIPSAFAEALLHLKIELKRL